MKKSYIFLVLLFIHSLCFAWEEKRSLNTLFQKEYPHSTFVLYDLHTNKMIGYNHSRAQQRYIPASTFKIAHSLIGLSYGAIKNVDETLPYKGEEKPLIQAWKADMSLREAIAISNVAIYQELARRIGLQNMKKGLKKLQYGNQKTSDLLERFWLDGPLKISALEQIDFLTKLATTTLEIPKHLQTEVQEILLLEETVKWKLYGKTGWQNAPNSGVGWFVGWINKESKISLFALNLDIKQPTDATQRIRLVKESLKQLGYI